MMRAEARHWVEQALADMKAADDNLKSENYYLVALLCQQTIEKALKALFIVRRAREPPKTHNLILLATELRVPARFRSTVDMLNPAYVFSRYPDISGGAPVRLYSRETVEPMLKVTGVLLTWIKKQLSR